MIDKTEGIVTNSFHTFVQRDLIELNLLLGMKLKGRNGAGDWLPLPSKPRFLAQYVEHTSSAPFRLTSPQYHLQFEPGQNQNGKLGF